MSLTDCNNRNELITILILVLLVLMIMEYLY